MKPTIQPKRVREAKDFLVAQTVEQAALEGIPLSELEKRMMYFTESQDAPEDPSTLNNDFEAQCDTTKYESKISRLLHHAYQRQRKENDEARAHWDDAIKCLRRGDHYLLVMWELTLPGERPCGDTLKLLVASLGVVALVFLLQSIVGKFEPQWRWLQKKIPNPNSHVMLGIFIAIVLVGFIFPRRVGDAVGWLLDHTFSAFLDRRKMKRIRSRFLHYFSPSNFSNSVSVRMGTPSSLALSYFEPGSVPTTT
jgi:hypothetical protein